LACSHCNRFGLRLYSGPLAGEVSLGSKRWRFYTYPARGGPDLREKVAVSVSSEQQSRVILHLTFYRVQHQYGPVVTVDASDSQDRLVGTWINDGDLILSENASNV